MNAALLDETTVVAYLKERKIFSRRANPLVEILTGGVSNVVLGISGEGKDLVLKQALPELKVKATWVADQRRALVEARAIRVLYSLTPNHVPKLYDVDPERFTLLIERAPRTTTNWKEDLLAGVIHPEVGADLGSILGQWHKSSTADSAILDEFREDSLFEQLRINPFYRTLAAKYQIIAVRINDLIEELEDSKTCLVHGDYSPKNILVEQNYNPIVLDFEVAHTGNPVFDLAFLLGHLLCKQEYSRDSDKKKAISTTAIEFLRRYESRLESCAALTLTWHLATIALARVDGMSPVSYLDNAAQINLRNRSIEILRSSSPPTLTEVFFNL
jgi:5-methylthioribose kinase